MANFPGVLIAAKEVEAWTFPGRIAAAYKGADALFGPVRVNDPPALSSPQLVAGITLDTGQKPAITPANFPGAFREDIGSEWFERFHVLPRSFAFGNILSTQTATLEVFSGFRREKHTWTFFQNNAGAGTSLLGAPSLPTIVDPLETITLTLQVTTEGPPVVSSTLDFGFDVSTIYIPISLRRVVLFPTEPERGFTEELEWLTDVLDKRDGKEQRRALRDFPRQFFAHRFMAEDGPERARLHNLLFDWQPRLFGLAMWQDRTILTAQATAGATTLSVQSTADADYRVGGLVLVYTSQTVFDVQEVASFTATSVVLVNSIANTYPAGTLVAPLRLAGLEESISGRRARLNMAQLFIRFRVDDNAVSIASTAGWPTYKSKVLISSDAHVRGELDETWDRRLEVVDSGSGSLYQESGWSRSKRTWGLGLFATNQAERWKNRQLLHALRGRQVSFYVATFFKDLVPAAALTSGSVALSVTNVGYADFVKSRQPQNEIRVVFNDGTTAVTRTVVGASEVSATLETLTVDTPWGATYQPSQIERIEYLEKVRLATDRVEIEHDQGEAGTAFRLPVVGVFE